MVPHERELPKSTPEQLNLIETLRKQFREQLRTRWNYIDVFALAMARAAATHFVADQGKWNGFLKDFKERTKDKAPKLFEEVFFNQREPFGPYSEQVESFFRVMARSSTLGTPNPSYQVYEMSQDTKRDIIESQESCFSRKELEVITELAKGIDDPANQLVAE